MAGLALVHLAVGFNPDSQLIKSRRIFFSRLAAWAAVGFLMLLPLIGYANWRGIRNIELTNKTNIATINAKASELKSQISQASTPRDLQERMLKFQGPTLPNESLGQPLDQLKKQALAFVQTSAKAFELKTPGPFSEQYMPIYKQSLRAAALSLVAALSFAACAWNPRTNSTLLNSITSLFRGSPYRPDSIFNVFTAKFQNIQKDLQSKKNQSARLDNLRATSLNIEKLKRQQELMQKRNLEKQRKAAEAREKKISQDEREAQKRRGQ
jgi:Skp family chaperone for outer membrane proteins